MKRGLTQVQAGPYTIRGVSVGGIYTSLQVPELGVVLDAGIALRSFAGTDTWLLSHAHADHAGALPAMLGIRGILRKPPPMLIMPTEIMEPLGEALRCMSQLQRFPLEVEASPMRPGDEIQLRPDLWVRAFRTHHPVPSLGYHLFRKVRKLRPEFKHLSGVEIGRRRKAGEDLFEVREHLELAYATDTLARVLDTQPELLESRVLILECTFLDSRKSMQDTHAGCHVHLDELLLHAERFQNEHIVLMHFSQLYSPAEVRDILKRRCPPRLANRIIPFAPSHGDWLG